MIVESDTPPDIPSSCPYPKPKNSPSTPSPSKQPLAFDNFDISPSKKKSATKQNKAGSSSSTSHKL